MSNLTSYKDFLREQEVIIRFQINADSKSAFIFYTYLLEREITNKSINYEYREQFLSEIYHDFISLYDLTNFKQPTKNQLKNFYWDCKKYEMAYFFMYVEDFYDKKPQFA